MLAIKYRIIRHTVSLIYFIFALATLLLATSSYADENSSDQVIARYLSIKDINYYSRSDINDGFFVLIKAKIASKNAPEIFVINDGTMATHLIINAKILTIKSTNSSFMGKSFNILAFVIKDPKTNINDIYLINIIKESIIDSSEFYNHYILTDKDKLLARTYYGIKV